MSYWSPFQDTAASKVLFTSAHCQLCRGSKVSPTLFRTDLRIADHRGHKRLITVTNAPSRPNLESNDLQVALIAIAGFPSIFCQLLQYSRQHPGFSAHWAALMTKTDLTCPATSLRFIGFAVQFCFRCKFSFREKRHSSPVSQWRDFPGPITILCYA